MGPHRDDTTEQRPTLLDGALAAQVEAIVRAAERQALVAERAIADRRRHAEEEVDRYLAAARLQVDAEAAARAARLETLTNATRRLADELADASAALHAELRRGERDLDLTLPATPWPSAPAAPGRDAEAGTPHPNWARADAGSDADAEQSAEADGRDPHAPPAAGSGEISNAARLVAIEMAVGGSPRADVDRHLRTRLGVADPSPLLDDVFGAASQATSRLAWGEP